MRFASTERRPGTARSRTFSTHSARKVAWTLQLVEDLERVPRQYFKKLRGTNELWEVRVEHGSNTYRLLGFFEGPHLVILAHGFTKKTQKTPRQAIDLAEERRRDHLSRRSSHE